MEFKDKGRLAVSAGLTALLALSPVAGGGALVTALADESTSEAASQSTAASKDVAVYVNGSNYGNWTMPIQAASVSDLPKGDAPEGQEFTGLWTVTWKDGTTTSGKGLDELSGDWGGVASITAEYQAIEQGGDNGEGGEIGDAEEPAQQINVTFKYDNASVATVADEDGKINASALGLPDNYTWTWTDAQGTVHEFGSDLLAGYVFTESCTVTGTPAEASEPVSEFVTVHLVDSDGTPIRDVTVQRNTSNWSGVLTDPTKEGYVFQGWQQEGESVVHPDLESIVMGVDDSVNEVTFKAVWKEAASENREIKVNFYDGDKLLGIGSVFNGTSQWSGIASPSKDGYIFTGWQFEGEDAVYTDAELDNVVYSADEQVTEINLYAQWEKAPEDARYITVNYYDGDKLIGTGAVLNGTNQWSGTTTPSKDGYTFLGWQFEGETAVTPDLSKVVYSADEQVTEINLYAQWQENVPEQRYITVNYWDGDTLLGTGAVLNGTSDWSGIVSPTKDGYTFAGWQFEGEDAVYTDAELDNVVYTADSSVTEINLYAQWNEVPESARYVTVHFYDEFGTYLGDGAVLNGTSDWSGPIVAPEVDGYEFVGWAEEGGSVYAPELLGKVVVAVPDDVTELTYVAHYQKKTSVPESRYITVNYWDGDKLLGTGAVLNGTSDWSGIVNPHKDGYTFLGWNFEGEAKIYTDEELDNVVYAADESVTEINLYANWAENSTPGTNPGKPGRPDRPSNPGNPGGTTKPDNPGTGTDEPGTEEPVAETHKVTFDDCLPNTENTVVEVPDGQAVARPADPTCEGWKFEGWYSDAELTQLWDFSTPVTQDMTLWAKWSQVTGTAPGQGADIPTAPSGSSTTKPAGGGTTTGGSKDALPNTGDPTVAASGIAGLGTVVAGLGAFLRRRR